MQADSLKKGDPWELDVGGWERAAQDLQVISNGNGNTEGPQVNFQNEISDPDECAKAANVTALREAEENRVLVEDERRETISCGARPRFITSC